MLRIKKTPYKCRKSAARYSKPQTLKTLCYRKFKLTTLSVSLQIISQTYRIAVNQQTKKPLGFQIINYVALIYVSKARSQENLLDVLKLSLYWHKLPKQIKIECLTDYQYVDKDTFTCFVSESGLIFVRNFDPGFYSFYYKTIKEQDKRKEYC